MSDMSRKEAIEVLKDIVSKPMLYSNHIIGACRVALASLETDEAYQLEYESTTKNLGVDYISRTSALDCINWAYNLSDAYEKINELPSVTPQLSSGLDKNSKKLEKNFGELDCISRKEAISWIENLRTLNEHYHPNAKNNYLIDCDSAIDYLKQVPSVLPKAKTGHWIAYHYGAYYLCSNCKEQHNSRYAKYCPNCGAKMDRKVRTGNDKRNYRGF